LSSVCLCGHPCCNASNRLGFESCYSQHVYYFVIRVLITCWYTQLSCNIILLSLKKKVPYTLQTRHHRSGSWFCSQLADTWDDTTSCMECKCPRPLGAREPVRAGRIRRRIDDRWRILPCGRPPSGLQFARRSKPDMGPSSVPFDHGMGSSAVSPPLLAVAGACTCPWPVP
jgi:hypothetical protein